MIKSKIVIFAAIGSILFSLCMNASEQRVGEGEILRPRATEKPPKIDGNLDDPAWQSGPVVTGSFITNHPVYGEELPQKTGVYITYDPDNIYFAFYCYDKEPGKIKASITRRDNIFGEDWIGVDLDTMGNRQVTYEFYCNPLGIQTDLLNSASGGESSEPDWVWYSAGKVVKDGYIVEMRIPLKSIQFKSGKNVTMTLAFYRYVSRTGANSSWPQISEKKGSKHLATVPSLFVPSLFAEEWTFGDCPLFVRIINTAVTIDHDCIIGNFVHLSPGVHLGGSVRMDSFSWIGLGASIINNIHVAEHAVVGASAVVIRNVEPFTVVAGNPAVFLRKKETEKF